MQNLQIQLWPNIGVMSTSVITVTKQNFLISFKYYFSIG